MPKVGQENMKAEASRINHTFDRLKSGYEKFIQSLVTMINEQHALIRSRGGKDTQILDDVGSIR